MTLTKYSCMHPLHTFYSELRNYEIESRKSSPPDVMWRLPPLCKTRKSITRHVTGCPCISPLDKQEQ